MQPKSKAVFGQIKGFRSWWLLCNVGSTQPVIVVRSWFRMKVINGLLLHLLILLLQSRYIWWAKTDAHLLACIWTNRDSPCNWSSILFGQFSTISPMQCQWPCNYKAGWSGQKKMVPIECRLFYDPFHVSLACIKRWKWEQQNVAHSCRLLQAKPREYANNAGTSNMIKWRNNFYCETDTMDQVEQWLEDNKNTWWAALN